MGTAYIELEKRFRQLSQLDHALTFLQWDQLVMMPPKGNEARSDSIAELVALRHQLLTEERVADLIHEAYEQETDPAICLSLGEMERCYQQSACLPEDLVKAKSLAGSRCEHGWRKQRAENDWFGFLDNFSPVVSLSRQEARARQEAGGPKHATPYDALLDLYCTGDDSDFITRTFSRLKDELPAVIEAIVGRESKEMSRLQGIFPTEKQQALSRKLMSCLGFDFEGGRLDVSLHPFSTGCRGDQRITTRYRESEFAEALLATAHETGHAAYEAGLPDRWRGLPVGEARNMCIHESQSLLFEKQLFLSQPFLSYFTPFIHELLPETEQYSAETIWHLCSRVEPSLIRVEADEATYPLHVILRFEIERDLINGDIEPKDIPELWDAKMTDYLGLSTRDNYRDGCLQDIHWTDGSFGYFPSYTMGALNAAQLFSAIRKSNPDWQDRLGRGDSRFIREWLSEAVWQKGCTVDSQNIVVDSTGEKTNPDYFLTHLRERYLS